MSMSMTMLSTMLLTEFSVLKLGMTTSRLLAHYSFLKYQRLIKMTHKDDSYDWFTELAIIRLLCLGGIFPMWAYRDIFYSFDMIHMNHNIWLRVVRDDSQWHQKGEGNNIWHRNGNAVTWQKLSQKWHDRQQLWHKRAIRLSNGQKGQESWSTNGHLMTHQCWWRHQYVIFYVMLF